MSLCKEMVGELQAEVLTEESAEAYFQHIRQNNDECKQVVRCRFALLMFLEVWPFEKNPRRECLGEFARKA